MKILQFISSLGGGGAEKQFAYLCKSLVELGHEVVAVSFRKGQNMDFVLNSGATYVQVHSLGNFDPFVIWKLRRLVTIHKPDILQSWIPQMDVFVGIVAALSNVPHILSERTSFAGLAQGWRATLRVAVGRNAAAIVANGKGGEEYWQPKAQGVHICVIPNAIPFTEIDAAIPISDGELSMKADNELVVYLGQLIQIKNISNLLSAMIEITSRRGQTNAVLIGDGPMSKAIEAEIFSAGFADRLRVVPYTKKPYSWLKRASVFVSISHFEGNPNSVLEAIAAGCPVVVSDIPAHREFLDERSANFVSRNSLESIVAGIIDVLENPGIAQKRAFAARERISGRSASAIALRYVQVYKEAIRARQK